MIKFSNFLKSLMFISLLVLIFSHQALAAKKQRNWRIGLGRMINTVYYGYETKNPASSYAKIEQNNLGLNYLNDLKQSNSQILQKEFFAINLISLLPDYLALNNPDSSNKINSFFKNCSLS